MLKKLFISNYAIIESIEIDFTEGFTTITGETGAGKSIILGALNLILGNRFDYTNFNNETLKCIVEGLFDISHMNLSSFFVNNDIDYDNDLVIRREFNYKGKSRTFINDTPVTLDIVKKIGFKLVDIHSQHENLLIYNKNFQIELVDIFTQSQYPDYQAYYKDYLLRFKTLNTMELDLEKKRQDCISNMDNLESSRKTVDNIHSLNLNGLNKLALENEYNKINNAYSIKAGMHDALEMFDGDHAILSNLNNIISKLSSLSHYDVEIAQVVDRLKENCIDISDICMDCHSINNKLSFSSDKLDVIREKLNSINSLEQDLKVSGVDEILNYCNVIEHKITLLDTSQEAIDHLNKSILIERSALLVVAKKISNYRQKSAVLLADCLKVDLSHLGMSDVDIEFRFTSLNTLSINGLDCIDLLFSANKGHSLNPIVNIASGGEIARLMLCIKKHLFGSVHFKTIIFDEIDSGVSGEIGFKMGQILKSMSHSNQIICITHLPQIASLGLSHYKVLKKTDTLNTTTNIIKLSTKQRLEEVARMLSGEIINEEAIANAKKMLDI
jgi:DNA repair protein RecN (Recombination protein N)